MKTIIWIIILIAISVTAVSWFMTKPLGDSKLEYVHFIPDKIIKCLNKYREQPTFLGTKDIIIGKDTGPSYRILEQEKFIKEIHDVCVYN